MYYIYILCVGMYILWTEMFFY